MTPRRLFKATPVKGGSNLLFGAPLGAAATDVWQKCDMSVATSKYIPILLVAAKLFWESRGEPQYSSDIKLAANIKYAPVPRCKAGFINENPLDSELLTTYETPFEPVIMVPRHGSTVAQLNCVSHMEEFKDFSLEELRFADYIYRRQIVSDKNRIPVRIEDILEAFMLKNIQEKI